MENKLQHLIDSVLEYDKHADTKLIAKAYDFAKEAHKGQKRVSGEDHFTHSYSVVEILLEFRPDVATICAALLHDVVEDTEINLAQIKKEFGKEIAEIVEGETKTTKVVFENPEDYTAENWRKILLATTKDVRVILIKLADRLHNMRTLKVIRLDKQKRIAKETMEIFAPIAHKLGLYSIKGELEDLSLRYLKPDIYQYIKNKINEKREAREAKAKNIIKIVTDHLTESGIEILEVSGRAKYFHSIYRKMVIEKKSFEEIYDLVAIRIIVKSIPDCYRVLASIHQLWKPIPGRFKDYIAVPKSNGYQSLHTDVATPFDSVLEVQIRTMEMHHVAKYGVAAHWRYKGTERDKKFDKRIAWMEQVLDWKRKASTDFLESLKVDLFQDEIVVFTPKGDPVILPEDATPVDFAYEIHSKVGDTCHKARVNKKLVSLDSKLKSGDVVYIITSPKGKPSRSWLSYVATSKARQRIRATLNIDADPDPRKGQKEKMVNLHKYIKFKGKGQLKISKCCDPQFGDDIVAYRMKDKTVTVHKKKCPNIHSLSSKPLQVGWDVEDQFIKSLQIFIEDKIGMVETILNTLMDMKVQVLAINLKPHKRSILISLQIKVEDDDMLEMALTKVRRIKHVNTIEVV